jgi:hypothetical protein
LSGRRYAAAEILIRMSILSRGLVVTALALASIACERQNDPSTQVQRGTTGIASTAAAANGSVDSVTAVRLVRDAILAHHREPDTPTFRVAEFVADSTGYRIILIPEPVLPGGGGQARVTWAGAVLDLQLFQ